MLIILGHDGNENFTFLLMPMVERIEENVNL